MPTDSRTAILFLHSSDDRYGSDRMLLNLASRLDRSTFRPIVALPDDIAGDRPLSKALIDNGIEVHRLPLAVLRRKDLGVRGLLRLLKTIAQSRKAIAKLITEIRIDVIHSQTSVVLTGAFLPSKFLRPHLWQCLEITRRPKWLGRILARLMRARSSLVIAASEATREHLVACCPSLSTKTKVVHYGIDLQHARNGVGKGLMIRKAWNIDTDIPLVGVVGRISVMKGQEFFLDVAKLVSELNPGARFVFVGTPHPEHQGVMERLLSRQKALGLEKTVLLVNYQEDIPAVMDALDVLALPSIFPDPFPAVVLEGMAAECAVVAHAQGGCVEMIEHGVSGLLVPPGNARAFAEAISGLLASDHQRSEMGRKAWQRVSTKFRVENYVGQWSENYLKFAPRPRA